MPEAQRDGPGERSALFRDPDGLGVELVLLFSYQLGWLPPSHMQSVSAARAGAARS